MRLREAGTRHHGGRIGRTHRPATVGASSSLEGLRTRVHDFIRALNYSLGKPFRWTYTGRPLQLAGVALVVCAVVLVEGVKLRRD